MRKAQRFSDNTPGFNTCIASPIINVTHRSGTFLSKMNLHWRHNSPKSIVYLRVHSWCCTFCGFTQTFNDMYPSLWYIFAALKILCALLVHLSSLPLLATTDLFNCHHSFTFPESHVIVGFILYVAFLDFLSVSNKHFGFSCLFIAW